MTAPPSPPAFDVSRYASAHRPIGLREVVIGTDALRRLPGVVVDLCTDGHQRGLDIVVLADEVHKRCLDADVTELVVSLVSGLGVVRTVTVARDEGGVHADEATITAAAAEAQGASVLVTVGSGTVADIGKAVASRLGGVTNVVVQTALSVNGYADDQSVLLVDGVKRTTPTRWPDALIADTQVLADAPLAMNLAGVGDLLAMFTAPADWRLAASLGMDDRYSEDVVVMVREHGAALLRAAPLLRERASDAIEIVAKVLTLSGISLGIAGTTAPGSGTEHTVSHLVEMAVTGRGSRGAFHGAQVGVAAVLASLVWRHVVGAVRDGVDELRCPPDGEMRPAVLGAFASLDASGAMAEECWRDFRRKLARWRDRHGEVMRLDRALVEDAASWLEEPRALVDALRAGGAPARFSELDPPVDGATARWALAHCHLMRDRFTVVDLAAMLGIWEEGDVDGIVDAAGRLGAGL